MKSPLESPNGLGATLAVALAVLLGGVSLSLLTAFHALV